MNHETTGFAMAPKSLAPGETDFGRHLRCDPDKPLPNHLRGAGALELFEPDHVRRELFREIARLNIALDEVRARVPPWRYVSEMDYDRVSKERTEWKLAADQLGEQLRTLQAAHAKLLARQRSKSKR